MRRASAEPWPPKCTECGGTLTRSAAGALCRSCIDGGVTLRQNIAPSEETDWLDGRGLAAWIAKHPVHPSLALNKRLAGMVKRWKQMDAVSVYDADEVLTALCFDLASLPDELWVNVSPRTAARYQGQAVKAEILARIERGDCARDLAKLYGVHEVTISRWKRKGLAAEAIKEPPTSGPNASKHCECESDATYEDLEGDEVCVTCGAYRRDAAVIPLAPWATEREPVAA